jgi:hypothetical protein
MEETNGQDDGKEEVENKQEEDTRIVRIVEKHRPRTRGKGTSKHK